MRAVFDALGPWMSEAIRSEDTAAEGHAQFEAVSGKICISPAPLG